MKTKQFQLSLALVLTASALSLGLWGCGGGGKDDPTEVALRPPKVEQSGGGGTPAGGGPDGNGGGGPVASPKEGFGSITGRIVIAESDASNVPQQDVIRYAVGTAPVDSGVCASQMPIFDDSLVVNPMNRGIKNTFFYLEEKPRGGKDSIASQSSWPGATDSKLVLDQINCTYKPHAMIVNAGESFTANSQDPVVHSYKGSPPSSTSFNENVPSNGSIEVNVFSRPESKPVPISCATHNWMSGYQLPLDHPYGAVTDDNGKFTITDLPSGDHEFIIWHEKGGTIFEREYTIVADEENDLGEITIRLSQLNK